MKTVKKGLCILAAISIIATSLFVGCAQKVSDPEPTVKEPTVKETTIKETTMKEEQKPVTLTWYVFGEKQPDHDLVMDEMNKKLKEMINATLDLQVLDAGSYQDRMGMIIASNEDYDICWTSHWRNNFYDNVSKGAFYPLDEIIPKYAPLLLETVGQNMLDVAKIAGKTYAVPNLGSAFTQWGIYIQKNLVEKYDFDINSIKELYDIEPFLEIIKENEPGLIPLRTTGWDPFGRENIQWDYEGLFAPFIGYKKGDQSLQVLPIKFMDHTRQAYLEFNSLFNKGYIRSDVFTVTDDSGDLAANRYASYIGMHTPGAAVGASERQGIEYVVAPINDPYVFYNAGIPTMNAISYNSKSPDRAIQFLELANTDKEIYNMFLSGLEDIHYTKVSEDQIEPIEDAKYNMRSLSWVFGNTFNAYYMPGQNPLHREEMYNINRTAPVSVFRGFAFDQTPVQAEIAQINAVKAEYKNIAFLPDWEKRFDEMLEKLKVAGIDTVVAEMQSQVDEWAKANR